MAFRDRLSAKTAALTLAFGLAQGSVAWAQEPAVPASGATASAVKSDSKTESKILSTSKLSTDPLVPVPVIAGLGLLYLGLCVAASRRRIDGVWAHAAAGGILGVALINPVTLREDREKLANEVLIVVDKSPSQSMGDRSDTTERMRSEIASRLSQIGGVTLRTVEIGTGRGENDGAEGTTLSAATAALSAIPADRLGAVILLTDGQIKDPEGLAAFSQASAPVHTFISGHDGERDRRLIVEQAPSFGLAGESPTIKFRVEDSGARAPSEDKNKIRVTIKMNGGGAITKMVTPGKSDSVLLPATRIGSNIVALEADPLNGELTAVNNSAAVSIEGIRKNLNVLLVSGEPSPGVRMWRSLLKSDPDSNLIHFTIMRPPEKQDITPLKELSLIPFPASEIFTQQLKKFDLIVLDRFTDTGMLPPAYFANMANYVKDGGALFVVAGPEHTGNQSLVKTALAPVLPVPSAGHVSEGSFVPKVSGTGSRHPVTRMLDGVSNPATPTWGPWLRQTVTSGASGKVLMEGTGGAPLLVLDRKNKGRVGMLMSDQAWLWERGYEGGGPYADLLSRSVRWLMKHHDLEEESLVLRSEKGKIIIEEQTMAEKAAPVLLRKPSGKTMKLAPQATSQPGIWRSSIEADELGVYSVEREGGNIPGAAVSVGPANPAEYADTSSTSAILKLVSVKTGGHIARMTDISCTLVPPRIEPRGAADKDKPLSGSDFIGVNVNEKTVLKGTERTPLLPPWLGIALTIGMLALSFHGTSGAKIADRMRQFKKGPEPS